VIGLLLCACSDRVRPAPSELPGTALKNNTGATVYTPPQEPAAIVELMRDLEQFINDDSTFDADPLVKMALIHHQLRAPPGRPCRPPPAGL
jgi:hypothetical protein